MTHGTNGSGPSSAGGGNALSGDDQRLAIIAAVAARSALNEYRAEQKRGRQDQGSGDEQLGTILRSSREFKGWTQQELGERAGLHATTIGKIESGQRGMSLPTFCKLAQIFSDADDWDFAWTIISYVAVQ
jgi:DNA-binding XRE family transcriptional regulator